MGEEGGGKKNLDYWTGFFHGANGSIFDIISNSIAIAALTSPSELRARRDRIIRSLFSLDPPHCHRCSSPAGAGAGTEEAGSVKNDRRGSNSGGGGGGGGLGLGLEDEEVEALTDEIEREGEVVREVGRIKEVLVDYQDQSENSLFESLRKLQLMDLSVDTLQVTEIGKAVNGIRKHNSKKIRQLARILIEGWKALVDEWAASAAMTAEKLNEGTNMSSGQEEEQNEDQEIPHTNSFEEEEEEGLPSPPLDEGAFLTTQPTGIQLSEFFDGMDDDGNLRNDAQFEKKQPHSRSNNVPMRRQQQEQPVIKQNRPPISQSPQMRPPQVNSLAKQRKPVNGFESGLNKPARPPVRRPPAGAQNNDRVKNFEDDKLEAAKRRLQEGYQQVENAKKQRTIQVLDDIPKQKVVQQNRNNVNLKTKNSIRSWAARH